MRSFLFSSVGWAILAALMPGMGRADESPSAASPDPSGYYAGGRMFAYKTKAREFLEANPQSEAAPRVLFDLAMLALAEGNKPAADDVRRQLIFSHPSSVYARWCLPTWPSADEYRKFLGAQFQAKRAELVGPSGKAYSQAVRMGMEQWGETFLAGDAFLLRAALAAHASRDLLLQTACCRPLRQSKEATPRRIVEIAFSGASDVTKVEQLHAMADDDKAAEYEAFFYDGLEDAERERPAMLRVRAESLLQAGDMEPALAVLEKHPDRDKDPQLLFWRAWCHAALGRPEPMKRLAERLAKDHSQSPWAADAGELVRAGEATEANLAVNVQAAIAVLEQLRQSNIDSLEGRLVHRNEGRELRVYLALLIRKGYCEVVAETGGRIRIAYRADAGQARVYFDGEPSVHVFQQNAPRPVFATQITSDNNDAFNFLWNFNFMDGSRPLAARNADFFSVDGRLLTPNGMTGVMRRALVKKGWLPLTVSEEKGERRFAWIRPQVRRPGFERGHYKIAAENRLTEVQIPSLACTDLRYGPAGAVTLSPPRWPDLPETVHAEMDPAVFFRMMGTAYSLLQSATETARKP